jgi:hypothetical protein
VPIVQQASGTWSGTSVTPTLPGASSASNLVVLIIAGNTTVTTPGSWNLRTSQVNQMGHYLYDRAGFSLTSVAVTTASGQGTWWIAEISGGVYDTSTSANSTSGSGTYVTPSLTPASGTRILIASLGSTSTVARTISGWTNSFVEQADVCQASADFPMQGVAVLDSVAANGSTAYSTTATYSLTSPGRSAIIASYATSAGGGSPSVTAALTGSGTLSAATAEVEKATAALTGSGALSAPVVPRLAVTEALSGSGTLSAAVVPAFAQTANLTGSGTLSATTQVAVTASATGSGSLTAVTVEREAAGASFTGSGSLSAAVLSAFAQVAALTGSGSLTASTQTAVTASATGSGALGATVAERELATATLSGSGTLTASAVASLAVTASLSGSGSLTASSVVALVADLSGSGTLSATVVPRIAVTAALSGSGTLSRWPGNRAPRPPPSRVPARRARPSP